MTTNAIPNGPCAKPRFAKLEKSVMMEFIYLCSETLVQSAPQKRVILLLPLGYRKEDERKHGEILLL